MGQAHHIACGIRLLLHHLTALNIFMYLLLTLFFVDGKNPSTVLDRRKLTHRDNSSYTCMNKKCSSSLSDCCNDVLPYDNFHATTVRNSFIVQFDGYYSNPDRLQYLEEAATLAGLNITQWGVLPHNGVANLYPSDFDLLQVDFQVNEKVYD